MPDLRNYPMMDKIQWVPRQTSTTSTEPSTPNSSTTQTEDSDLPDEPGRSRSSSDASSSSDNNDYLSAAHFDILWCSDVREFNAKDGSIRFRIFLNNESRPPPKVTQPIPGKKYTATFEMGNCKCMYRCEASADGMAWEKFRALRRNKAFKSEFQDGHIYFELRGDVLDDDGVPMMRLFLGQAGCTGQCVACWAKMRDNAWGDEARFSDAEIARIRVFEKR